jgi:hypothetical protein
VAAEHALEDLPRVRLVSEVVQRGAHHPLAAEPIDRIGRQAAKSIHQHPCHAGLAAVMWTSHKPQRAAS